MKMTTRLIILDCAGYISSFKAVIVCGSKKLVFRSIKSKNNSEGGFLLDIWGKMRLPKKGRQKNCREMR